MFGRGAMKFEADEGSLRVRQPLTVCVVHIEAVVEVEIRRWYRHEEERQGLALIASSSHPAVGRVGAVPRSPPIPQPGAPRPSRKGRARSPRHSGSLLSPAK